MENLTHLKKDYFKIYQELLDFVKPYYEEQHRYFHNFDHILYGIQWINFLENNKIHNFTKEEVIAWIFHDIVYIPGSKNNELDSANLFLYFLNKKEVSIFPKDLNKEIVTIIIQDTKEHKSTIKESKYILDIDISSMGLRYVEFYKGRKNIRKEFNNFTDEEFIKGNKVFFKELLKEEIFSTDFFKQYTKRIKKNIKKFIKELELGTFFL